MVPLTWELIGAAPNVTAILKSTTTDWKTELVPGDINLGEVNINWGIFQGDFLSPLLFIISLISLAPGFYTDEKRILISEG